MLSLRQCPLGLLFYFALTALPVPLLAEVPPTDPGTFFEDDSVFVWEDSLVGNPLKLALVDLLPTELQDGEGNGSNANNFSYSLSSTLTATGQFPLFWANTNPDFVDLVDDTLLIEPAANFCGQFSFRLDILDLDNGNQVVDQDNLVVTVWCVNDPPVAHPIPIENGNVCEDDEGVIIYAEGWVCQGLGDYDPNDPFCFYSDSLDLLNDFNFSQQNGPHPPVFPGVFPGSFEIDDNELPSGWEFEAPTEENGFQGLVRHNQEMSDGPYDVPYMVVDPNGAEAWSTMSLKVNGVNDPPTFESFFASSNTLYDGETVTVEATGVSDIENDLLSITLFLDGFPSGFGLESIGNFGEYAWEITADSLTCGMVDVVLNLENWSTLNDHDPGCADSENRETADTLQLTVNLLDFDEDGIPDNYTTTIGGEEVGDDTSADNDADGDGISDFDEQQSPTGPATPVSGCAYTLEDFDGDDIPNFLDLDSDGDGIEDAVEMDDVGGDIDDDGMPNFLDIDSDGDGILDEDEYAGLVAGDMVIFNVDTDGDGLPDFLDTDSDNDMIPDAIEDADHDGNWDVGETDFRHADSDRDGIEDGVEFDSGLNPLDMDSDDDGLPDGPGHPSTLNQTGISGVVDLFDTWAEDRNGDGDVGPPVPGDGTGNNPFQETDPGMVDTDSDCLSDGIERGLSSNQSVALQAAMEAVQFLFPGYFEGTSPDPQYTCSSCAGVQTLALGFPFDADPTTATNARQADTDGDGLSDGTEDANRDGAFTDPDLDPAVPGGSPCNYVGQDGCLMPGTESDPNSICSPDCTASTNCNCDGDGAENGPQFCSEAWNALCGDNGSNFWPTLTGEQYDFFTVDGATFDPQQFYVDNNDTGESDDGDDVPDACDNCTPGLRLAYEGTLGDETSWIPFPEGSFFGSTSTGATSNLSQGDFDNDGIGDLCDAHPGDGGLLGCMDPDACNYNPFASGSKPEWCTYGLPSVPDGIILSACADDDNYPMLPELYEAVNAASPWGTAATSTIEVTIAGSNHLLLDSDGIYGVNITNIGANCTPCEVTLTRTVILDDNDRYFSICEHAPMVDCTSCGVDSSLEQSISVDLTILRLPVTEFESDTQSDTLVVCSSTETATFSGGLWGFPSGFSDEDYAWAWSSNEESISIGEPAAFGGSFSFDPIDVDSSILLEQTVSIGNCPSSETAYLRIYSSSTSRIDVLTLVDGEPEALSTLPFCSNASDTAWTFQVEAEGGSWPSTNVTWVGGDMPDPEEATNEAWAVALPAGFGDTLMSAIFTMVPDPGCLGASDTVVFTPRMAPALTLLGDAADGSILVCENAENLGFQLELLPGDAEAAVPMLSSDSDDLAIEEPEDFSETMTYTVEAPASWGSSTTLSNVVVLETDISAEPAPFGCETRSQTVEITLQRAPETTDLWAGLAASPYCAPETIALQGMIEDHGADASIWSPNVSFPLDEVDPDNDGLIAVEDNALLLTHIDNGQYLRKDDFILGLDAPNSAGASRGCASLDAALTLMVGATPVIEGLSTQTLAPSGDFSNPALPEGWLPDNPLCQGSEVIVSAQPTLLDQPGSSAGGDSIAYAWSYGGTSLANALSRAVDFTALGLTALDEAELAATATWSYDFGGDELHGCSSESQSTALTFNATLEACTGCPIEEFAGPAYLACAQNADNGGTAAPWIQWGWFELGEGEPIPHLFPGATGSLFYPTAADIQTVNNAQETDITEANLHAFLFAMVSFYGEESRDCPCVSLSPTTVVTGIGVHWLEHLQDQVHLYPNPARDQLTLDLPPRLWTDPLELALYNGMGQPVHKAPLPPHVGRFSLDLPALPAGQYFLRLTGAQGKPIHQQSLLIQP